MWESNKAVANTIAEKSQPIIHRYEIPVSDDFNAQVRLQIPSGADLSGSTKYPMLVEV